MHALFLSPLACLQERGGELYLCRRNVTELQFKAELVERKREDFDVDTEEAKRQLACEGGVRAPDMELKIRVVLGVVVVWKEGRNKKVFLVSGPLLFLQGRSIQPLFDRCMYLLALRLHLRLELCRGGERDTIWF